MYNSPMLTNKTILIGITGGISAYKICTLIRLYKKAHANVRVVVTPNALNFVTKLTLQTLSGNEVYIDSFEIDEYKPEHIALTESDIFVIAPASANTVSKIANGICDNLLTTTACAFSKPILLAPAMNTNMWNNPFVRENLAKLKAHGYYILEPDDGFLACGTSGTGRMREVEEIFDKTVDILFSANSSSGKMGFALADAAYAQGADVTLISTFKAERNYTNIVVETAQDMERAVKESLKNQDCVIMAAAVSDYRAANPSVEKIKKDGNDKVTLELVKNPDILKEIAGTPNTVIVGFCAESENLIENAKIKIQNKGCDYLVANDISRKDIGFNSDENEVYILDKNLNIKHLEKDSKQNIAKQILEEIFE